MDTRDSGVIDLFAIHKEEERRISTPAPPMSGPPPAVSFDTHAMLGEDADVDALALSQQASRKRAKIIGGVIGAFAVMGILIAAIASGGKEPAKDTTASASQPPAAAVVLPAPAVDPTPAPATPAAPSTAKAEDDKPAGYGRAQAVAAYNQSQGKAGKKTRSMAPKAGGPKMQKIQSGGTN